MLRFQREFGAQMPGELLAQRQADAVAAGLGRAAGQKEILAHGVRQTRPLVRHFAHAPQVRRANIEAHRSVSGV